MNSESIELYKKVLQYVKPYWKLLLLSMLFMFGVAGCTSLLAYLVKPALNGIFFEKKSNMLNLVPLAILITYAFRGIFNFTQDYLMNYVGQKVIMDIRQKLFEHIQKLPLNQFLSVPVGDLVSRTTNDVFILQSSVSRSITSLIKDFFTALGLIGVVFYNDYKLAIIAFIGIPFIFVPILRYGLKAKKYSYRVQGIMGNMLSFLKEYFSSMRVVKVFSLEEMGKKRFFEENNRYFKNYMKQIKVRAISAPVIDMLAAIAISFIIWYGGKQVISGNKTPGDFFSFITALVLMYEPIKKINASLNSIQEGIGASKRLFEIFNLPVEEPTKENLIEMKGFFSEISFKNVSFKYNTKYILKDITFTVKKGEKVGIVGHSGEGKSTLLNLIPRFYEVSEGAIYIDGIDIRNFTLESLRSNIAMVTQEVILFNSSIKENIKYGRENASDEEIVEAAKHAFAHDFIVQTPNGYNTNVGEMGELLSGGERQRIAIARAFIKNAPILLLDEATSALDSKSEKEVQKALNMLMEGRTCFIVAHRLSTLTNVDKIIVLKRGRIVEMGTPAELYGAKGEYYKLCKMQSHGVKLETN
jgi:subfamily B ATP-binding cassette protein MsbA